MESPDKSEDQNSNSGRNTAEKKKMDGIEAEGAEDGAENYW